MKNPESLRNGAIIPAGNGIFRPMEELAAPAVIEGIRNRSRNRIVVVERRIHDRRKQIAWYEFVLHTANRLHHNGIIDKETHQRVRSKFVEKKKELTSLQFFERNRFRPTKKLTNKSRV